MKSTNLNKKVFANYVQRMVEKNKRQNLVK